MKLMVKSAKEMLAVLDETKETLFKDKNAATPTQSGKIKSLSEKVIGCHYVALMSRSC
jgi:hypothetical protein